MQRDTSMPRRKARWVRNVALLAVVFGMFAATPVTAWAKQDQNNNGNHNGEGNGGHDNGKGNNGNNSGDHGNTTTGSNPSGSVPEVPYAAVLPIVIIGMTVFVYRRRTKSA